MTKKIGFLSFGFWQKNNSMVTSAAQSYAESVDLAVEAEKLGIDGAWYRVHHFADQIGTPYPLMAAVGAKTSKIEIGTGLVDMRYENPFMMAENVMSTDVLSQNRVQLGVGRGSPEQVEDGWRYWGYDYSEEEIKDIARARTLKFLDLLKGEPFAQPNAQPMFPQEPGLRRLEPFSPTLHQRIWWGAGSQATAIWAAEHGMNLQSSTLVNYETNEPFHVQQAKQLRAFKDAWQKAGHDFKPRTLVTRSIMPIVNDLDAKLFAEGSQTQDEVGYLAYHQNPTIFGKMYVGEPDQLVKELAEDEAIQEADTILITVPSTLGLDYNVHILDTIMKDIAPALGWK
ncbi:MAG: LLM class flavin-dependent oxidoreductase [Lactobacillus sp.]|jgi:alkanesulfonate monooxygenase SsuD/methylene tetrahydromethanopterin reductase-like flavin-dependent oxidoreductase (luciferase family)|nr:LLM class flavin-dependent oxidoreductase [Lactobacillus sp.]MCI2031867.1 LLM class flavin-dependent oxidoreductase [Lactobacillus sp.]